MWILPEGKIVHGTVFLYDKLAKSVTQNEEHQSTWKDFSSISLKGSTILYKV